MNTSPRYRINMRVEEFDRLYLEDIDTHQRRSQYEAPDIIRKIKKANRFPIRYVVREQHGAEKYCAYMTIQSKKEPFKTGLNLDSVIYFKNSRGVCAYINLDPFKLDKVGAIYSEDGIIASHRFLFTPHFFERYEMRHGFDPGFIDIHDQFFFNNLASDDHSFYTQSTKARPGDYKTIDVWSLCEDGVMLGEVKSEDNFNAGRPYIMQMNTFLDLDTLTRRQDKYVNILESMKAAFGKVKIFESEEDKKKRTFITTINKL